MPGIAGETPKSGRGVSTVSTGRRLVGIIHLLFLSHPLYCAPIELKRAQSIWVLTIPPLCHAGGKIMARKSNSGAVVLKNQEYLKWLVGPSVASSFVHVIV